MGLSLAAGGHLTHGAPPNLSGKWFKAVQYGVRRKDALIDFDEVERLAHEHKPKLIIAGGSAYPRIIDFARFRKIADAVGAYLMVDMAHFAGLVAAGVHPSPLPHAHVVTTTTHKTLRGPRGGMILSHDEEIGKEDQLGRVSRTSGRPADACDRRQGGRLRRGAEAGVQDLRAAVVENAQTLAATLVEAGLDIVSGGTDTHLMLVDLRPKKLTGTGRRAGLERAHITCNKNGIPFDPEKPTDHVGHPPRLAGRARRAASATAEFRQVGELIAEVLDGLAATPDDNSRAEARVRGEVAALCRRFPIYPDLL